MHYAMRSTMFFPTISSSHFFLAAPVATAQLQSSKADTVSVTVDINDSNLPWDSLIDCLSVNASLVAPSNQDYIDQCYPEFRDKPQANRTRANLKGQPSGICN